MKQLLMGTTVLVAVATLATAALAQDKGGGVPAPATGAPTGKTADCPAANDQKTAPGGAAPACPAKPAEKTAADGGATGAAGVESLTITGQKPSVPPNSSLPENIPAVVEGMDAAKIAETVNAMTTPEMLKYFPSILVRERYIGDTNAIIATRTTGTVSSAETLLYADDLLLSNLLGNSYSYPPRWGMVAINEIERIDVMYGPFSALYPGNSMGGVVTLTTRMPTQPEAHIDLKGFVEDFNLFGTHQDNLGWDGSAAFGNRVGNLSYWVNWDHLDSEGHPLDYDNPELSTGKACGGGGQPACGLAVNGYRQYVDNDGKPAYIFGSYAAGHSLEDSGNLKLAYDLTPALRATYTLGIWQNETSNSTQTFLTTATGQPIYNGTVDINGKNYTLASLDPSTVDEFHMMNSVSLKSNTHGVWDVDLSASNYSYLIDNTRSSSDFGVNNNGTNTDMDGTGWYAVDLRGVWRPEQELAGRHEVSFGYHFDRYQLDQVEWNNTGWETGPNTTFNSASHGTTETNAVYLQDAWKFMPGWMLTLGGREEYWQAFGGSNENATSTAEYPSQSTTRFSPKASVSYQVTPELLERVSAGEAYRFPTVTELFQQITNSGAIVNNDPALLPEQVWSFDWTSQYTVGQNSARVSLFDEELWNAIFSQTNTTVTPNVTETLNVNRVRIGGVETAVHTHDLGIKKLDFDGSLTFAASRILSDTTDPANVGNQWPRIPEWRVTGLATYHQTDDLSYSAGVRYSSAAFATITNVDVNHDVYAGLSQYLVGDARVNYKIGHGITLAAGIDNIGDYKYYVNPHPYPQVTFFSEIKYDY